MEASASSVRSLCQSGRRPLKAGSESARHGHHCLFSRHLNSMYFKVLNPHQQFNLTEADGESRAALGLGLCSCFRLLDKYLLCSRPRIHTENKMAKMTRGFCSSRVCVLVTRPRKQNNVATTCVKNDRLDKSAGKCHEAQ